MYGIQKSWWNFSLNFYIGVPIQCRSHSHIWPMFGFYFLQVFVCVYFPPIALPTSWPFGRCGTMLFIWYLIAAHWYMLPIYIPCPFSWVLELKMSLLSQPIVCVETHLDLHGIITQYIFYLISVSISDSWILPLFLSKVCFLVSISMYLVEGKTSLMQ